MLVCWLLPWSSSPVSQSAVLPLWGDVRVYLVVVDIRIADCHMYQGSLAQVFVLNIYLPMPQCNIPTIHSLYTILHLGHGWSAIVEFSRSEGPYPALYSGRGLVFWSLFLGRCTFCLTGDYSLVSLLFVWGVFGSIYDFFLLLLVIRSSPVYSRKWNLP